MIVGGYDLHLYCDVDSADGMPSKSHHGYKEGAGQFYGETRADAMRSARQSGWAIRHGKATCPKCRKAGRRAK